MKPFFSPLGSRCALPNASEASRVAGGHSGLGPATRLSLQKLQLLKEKKQKFSVPWVWDVGVIFIGPKRLLTVLFEIVLNY